MPSNPPLQCYTIGRRWPELKIEVTGKMFEGFLGILDSYPF